MKVRVRQGWQTAHDDKVYAEGETADVPAEVARAWVTAGYAEEVKASKKTTTRKEPQAAAVEAPQRKTPVRKTTRTSGRRK